MKIISYATKVVPLDEITEIQNQMEQGIDMEESGGLRELVEKNCIYLATLGIDDEIDEDQVSIPICQLRFGQKTPLQDNFSTSYVKVRMFTGDHLDTAIAVAQKCNIISEVDTNKNPIDQIAVEAKRLVEYFSKFVALNPEDGEVVFRDGVTKPDWTEAFKPFASNIRVIARCTPEDKLFFVKILQK